MIGKVLKAGVCIATLMGLASCASFSGVETSRFKSSSFSDLNPAPKKMSPPQVTEDQSIDPVYMRSQADYHFTMAEALSLDGKVDAAIEQFKLTLVYDPNSAVVRKRLAEE